MDSDGVSSLTLLHGKNRRWFDIPQSLKWTPEIVIIFLPFLANQAIVRTGDSDPKASVQSTTNSSNHRTLPNQVNVQYTLLVGDDTQSLAPYMHPRFGVICCCRTNIRSTRHCLSIVVRHTHCCTSISSMNPPLHNVHAVNSNLDILFFSQ